MELKKEYNFEKFSASYTDKKEAYQPYKKAFWEGINLDDEKTIRNPFFVPKLKLYFTNIIDQSPDSVIVEVDKFLLKPKKESLIYKYLIAFFTNQSETSKILGHDKIFVHMSDAYFKTGKANGFFEKHIIESVIRKADKVKPLLIGSKAPNLFLTDVKDKDIIISMGFENSKTSEEITQKYYANKPQIEKLFKELYAINSEYIVLVFWDIDCGHCQKEIPKLKKVYDELISQNKKVKVVSIYTQHNSKGYQEYITKN
jgi:thiol-disulfide isomerase/thioredoxin